MALIVLLWSKFFLFKSGDEAFGSEMNTKPMENVQLASANNSIANYHIFGSAQQLYEIPLSQGNTSLNLTLNGTMSHTDTSSGLAYISNVQGIQNKYKVGDKVFDMAELLEIHKTYVVLENNGKKERLSLPEKLSDNSNRDQSNNVSNSSSAIKKHLKNSNQPDWNELMEQQKFDPNKIANIVNNSTLLTDQSGQIQGIKVSNLASGTVDLAKVGLKPSDIITAVNGNKISGKNLLEIGKTIQESPSAIVTIKRNGKTHTIEINKNDLNR